MSDDLMFRAFMITADLAQTYLADLPEIKALGCDKCRAPTLRRVAVHTSAAPPQMLCPACYRAIDFDSMEHAK